MNERLSRTTLGRLPASVRRPTYDRNKLKRGVVHIGLGAFHRAHQAPAFEYLVEGGDLRWGIVGASLRSPAVHDALAPQDCLYSLAVEDGSDRRISVIGVLCDVIVAPEGPRRLIDAIASPETELVTVTVTEKGYNLDPAFRLVLEEEPEVRADLANPPAPSTLAGYLTAGLLTRMERGLGPLTIISCDNIAANGRNLRDSVVQVASAQDADLAEWIEDSCAFPDTMIDRIVPATTETDIERIAAELGFVDRATVRTEPFSQWVIEDRFAGKRPELERAGVQFTSDVAPWEEAKLRLLNGPHSAMAYLGGLAGIPTVDRFVAEPWGRAFVDLLWDELQPTLDPPPQLDLGQYRSSLMQRFANSALGHRLVQIAMDGSQKIPQRLVPAAMARLDRGQRLDAIALAIAAWMRWQGGRTDDGGTVSVDDPLASTTWRLLKSANGAREQARSLLSLSSIFPSRLSADAQFLNLVAEHLDKLQRIGARATVQQFVLEPTGTA